MHQLAELSREMRQRLWAHQELQRLSGHDVLTADRRLSSLASNDELLARAEELRSLATYEASAVDQVAALLSRHDARGPGRLGTAPGLPGALQRRGGAPLRALAGVHVRRVAREAAAVAAWEAEEALQKAGEAKRHLFSAPVRSSWPVARHFLRRTAAERAYFSSMA